MKIKKIDAEKVRELFDYKDGQLYWKKNGKVAGSLHKASGYYTVYVDGSAYRLHRVIWAWHYGCGGDMQTDHINRDPGDNRIENLRLVTCEQNQHNNNAKGYYWNKREKKFVAQVRFSGKREDIGYYDNELDARAAYLRRKREVLVELSLN